MPETLLLEGEGGASGVLDCLAYVDPLTDKDRQLAEALIDQERREMHKEGLRESSYIAKMIPLNSYMQFKDSPTLRGEMERIAKGQLHMDPLDTSNTRLETPRLHDQQNVAAWERSASNAAAQLEHQYNRIVNFRVGVKYGPAVWRAHNTRTEGVAKMLDEQLKTTNERITQINRRRKLKQDAAGADMKRLRRDYDSVLRKNIDIRVACHELEQKVAAAEDRAREEREAQLSTAVAASATGQAATAATVLAGEGTSAPEISAVSEAVRDTPAELDSLVEASTPVASGAAVVVETVEVPDDVSDTAAVDPDVVTAEAGTSAFPDKDLMDDTPSVVHIDATLPGGKGSADLHDSSIVDGDPSAETEAA